MLRSGTSDSEAFACEVCWHYYVNEMTQSEVAKAMGVTRLRVNQAIQHAKSLGMVRVQLESPFLSRITLQEELRSHLALDKVMVAPANPDAYNYHLPAGAALASYLVEKLNDRKWQTIGVSWGMTLQSAINKLPRLSKPGLEIVSMIGGTTTGASFNAFGIASGFAERLGANYSLFAAPIYLSRNADREAFLAQDIFEDHLRKCGSLDAALLVAGDLSSRSYLISTGLPKDTPIEDLHLAGAVGDVLGRFLDRDGNDIEHPINQRTVGVDLDVLKAIPEKIMAAAGHHKIGIIRAAVKRGLVNTLITDDVTARQLLGEE